MDLSMDFFVVLYLVALVAIAWNGSHEEWGPGLPGVGILAPLVVSLVAVVGMVLNV